MRIGLHAIHGIWLFVLADQVYCGVSGRKHGRQWQSKQPTQSSAEVRWGMGCGLLKCDQHDWLGSRGGGVRTKPVYWYSGKRDGWPRGLGSVRVLSGRSLTGTAIGDGKGGRDVRSFCVCASSPRAGARKEAGGAKFGPGTRDKGRSADQTGPCPIYSPVNPTFLLCGSGMIDECACCISRTAERMGSARKAYGCFARYSRKIERDLKIRNTFVHLWLLWQLLCSLPPSERSMRCFTRFFGCIMCASGHPPVVLPFRIFRVNDPSI